MASKTAKRSVLPSSTAANDKQRNYTTRFNPRTATTANTHSHENGKPSKSKGDTHAVVGDIRHHIHPKGAFSKVAVHTEPPALSHSHLSEHRSRTKALWDPCVPSATAFCEDYCSWNKGACWWKSCFPTINLGTAGPLKKVHYSDLPWCDVPYPRPEAVRHSSQPHSLSLWLIPKGPLLQQHKVVANKHGPIIITASPQSFGHVMKDLHRYDKKSSGNGIILHSISVESVASNSLLPLKLTVHDAGRADKRLDNAETYSTANIKHCQFGAPSGVFIPGTGGAGLYQSSSDYGQQLYRADGEVLNHAHFNIGYSFPYDEVSQILQEHHSASLSRRGGSKPKHTPTTHKKDESASSGSDDDLIEKAKLKKSKAARTPPAVLVEESAASDMSDAELKLYGKAAQLYHYDLTPKYFEPIYASLTRADGECPQSHEECGPIKDRVLWFIVTHFKTMECYLQHFKAAKTCEELEPLLSAMYDFRAEDRREVEKLYEMYSLLRKHKAEINLLNNIEIKRVEGATSVRYDSDDDDQEQAVTKDNTQIVLYAWKPLLDFILRREKERFAKQNVLIHPSDLHFHLSPASHPEVGEGSWAEYKDALELNPKLADKPFNVAIKVRVNFEDGDTAWYNRITEKERYALVREQLAKQNGLDDADTLLLVGEAKEPHVVLTEEQVYASHDSEADQQEESEEEQDKQEQPVEEALKEKKKSKKSKKKEKQQASESEQSEGEEQEDDSSY